MGAYDHDSKGTVRIYTYNGTAWTQQGSDLDGESGDRQGSSVSLSSDGTTLAVGAVNHDNRKGTVRIYTYNGTAWTQQGSDLDGESTNENQGKSVSLSSDGTTLAVGAWWHPIDRKGTVRIYTYNGTAWSQQGSDIDGVSTNENQGTSVSLSSDGTTLATGAYNHVSKGTVRVYNLINPSASPIASNVSAATVKNTNASIHLVASDADYDSLTYSIVSTPSSGTATLSGETVTYVPNTDFIGTDSFTFKANDGAADSATKTVTIKVIDGYLATANQIGLDIDGETGDSQGFSVSFNEDHSVMAVGASVHDSNKGTVRIYTYNGTVWTQQGSDLDGEANDRQGWTVSLSSDGTILAVGSQSFNSNGTVRVYLWNGSSWIQQGTDIDSEEEDWSRIVSLSSDGNILAVGAEQHDGLGGLYKGTVKVYRWNGTIWNRLGVNIDGEERGDNQGHSVSLSSDGLTLATGANRHNGSGTVRVYNWNGSNWIRKGGDLDGAAGDRQGTSVSLSSDGTTLAVGASRHDSRKGTVRVYTYNGTAWSQQGSDLDGAATDDNQGQSVSLSSDGMTLAVGAYGHDGRKGTLRIYNYNGTAWTQNGSDLDGEVGDQQGISVSLSSDGTTLAVGAPNHDSNKGTLRVYSLIDSTAPTVSSVTSTKADGSYNLTELITNHRYF